MNRAKRSLRLMLALTFAASVSLAQTPSALQITSPADRTVVAPGDTVTFSVKADPSISQIAIMGPLGYSETLTGPLQFSFTVPMNAHIDQYEMSAVGLGADGLDIESNPVTLAVESPQIPTGIRVRSPALHFDKLGVQLPLEVIGLFPDGSQGDITYSTKTNYSSSSPGVVLVDSRGWVTAVGPGRASINISNPGGSAIVPVQVKTPDNPTGDTTPPSTTVALAPAANAAGWNNTDVTFTLTSQDNLGGSGVSLIAVQATGAETINAAAPSSSVTRTISLEGATNVAYFSVDQAGNRETPQLFPVRVDKSAPTIAGLPGPGCSLPESGSLIQVATVTAADSLSGVATFNVAVSSNEPIDASDLVISGTGVDPRVVELRPDQDGTTPRTYTFTATATDVAGNSTSATATCSVVDN